LEGSVLRVLDMTRTFLPLSSLIAVLPLVGCYVSDPALRSTADTPQVEPKTASDVSESGPRRVFNPAPINALLERRERGQAQPRDPRSNWAVSFKQQIYGCWKHRSAPVEIDVNLSFRPDGTLAAEPLLVHSSDAVDYPEAVTSVLKAVKECVPVHLPPEDYERWRTIEVAFVDERQLLSGPALKWPK
jgi:hypothetical protein